MGTMSIWHWVIVLVVILLLFGARRIPDLASSLGSGIKNFKKAVKEEEGEKAQDTTMQATSSPVSQTQATPSDKQPQAQASTQATEKPNEQAKV